MNLTPQVSSVKGSIKGRVLTRRVRFDNGRPCLEYFVASKAGPVQVNIDQAEWTCFCHQSQTAKLLNRLPQNKVQVAHLDLKSFENQSVSVLYVKTAQELTQIKRVAIELDISLFETDIRPEQRFLIERFISFDAEFLGEFTQSTQSNLKSFNAIKARKINEQPNIELKSVSLDFECSPSSELYSVGLYADGSQGKYQKVIMVGEPEPHSKGYIVWVADEKALILALIDWFESYDPDIIIGWAVVVFDLALLYKRAIVHEIPLTIGRNQQLMSWKVENKFRPETLSFPGRVVLDGIDWLKAAFYSFENFSLDNVARELLDEGKAIDDVKGRGSKIAEMFENDKLSLAHYNLTDCRLVWDIFEKTKLWDFAIARSQLTGLEFGRVGASVAAFNNLYLPNLHRHGYVAPESPASDGLESPGGYVMDSIPGLYKNVLLLDFKSLYPSIIRTFLIDPKGLIEGLAATDDQQTVEGFLGAKFSRESPILPSLIAELTAKRELAKKSNDAPLSHAIKIIMNSLYGVLGSTGCVFHDAKLASSITMRGHEIMKQTKKWIESEGCQVIYGDTDSTFIWLGDSISKNEAKQKGNDLVELVNRNWKQELEKTCKLECFLELEFERHYEQFFMPTLRGSDLGSKKRYVGTFRNEQQQIELIFKGMENVRNDWSKLAKRVQFELYTRLFERRPLSEFLSEQISQLKSGVLDGELLFSKKLSRNLDQYSAKASPHVKVAQSLLNETGDDAYRKRGARIDYLITVMGPQAVLLKTADIDYQYYIEKQLKPIAEPVFTTAGESLNNVLSNQLNLL